MKQPVEVCELWKEPNPQAAMELTGLIEEAVDGPTRVFFRADDIGEVDSGFRYMIQAFKDAEASLGLAVVPSWLDRAKWRLLLQVCPEDDLWAWHQHGYRHLNFEPSGKKNEFGAARPAEEQRRDLAAGFKRLDEIMGRRFTPIFTPPWNRMSPDALSALPGLGFKAVSRSLDASPEAPDGLRELPVRVDLHTRKEPDAKAAWRAMHGELKKGLAAGLCGVMLHHQLMNQAGVEYLAALLGALKRHPEVSLVSMAELI
jgi:hypothetical protein